MKKMNLHLIALVAMLLTAFIAGISSVSGQSSHGQMSVTMGNYTIDGFGEVSTPEMGNQFHRLNVESYISVNKRESLYIGATAHSWSRYNGVVNSASPLIKGRLRGDRMMVEIGAGPTFQYRGYSAVGATVIAKGEFRLLDEKTTVLMNVHAEAGNRGLFYDQSIGLRHRSLEGRFGVSSVTQGEYVQLNYFTCERYSLGVTYACDRAMNKMLETQGYGDFHRRALGIQATVIF